MTSRIQQPDASELILCNDERFACETYIFEPSTEEASLGRLYAVGEAQKNDGVGSELLDLTIQAMQREYYRDPSRGVLASFESALHQANLVLHDTVEQGVRGWMGCFHVAVGVLAGSSLHVSTSGDASVFLVRNSKVTLISQNLAHSPITNPLHTFAQVASGTIAAKDTIFLGTSALTELFREEDLARFAIEHSATTITTRLQQLYFDQKSLAPLSALTVSILPQQENFVVEEPEKATDYVDPKRRDRNLSESLSLKKPLIIHRSILRSILAIIFKLIIAFWVWIKNSALPALVKGSMSGSKALVSASTVTGRKVTKVTKQGWSKIQHKKSNDTFEMPKKTKGISLSKIMFFFKNIKSLLQTWLLSLPKTSKIFAILTVLLAIALILSLTLLQSKRVKDADIQKASEVLQETRTKQAAAETALIYGNRDQAHTLLKETEEKITQLESTGAYKEEVVELKKKILNTKDRLQRVTRASTENTGVVGDFKDMVKTKALTSLILVDNNLYTFDVDNNSIIKMDKDGNTSKTNENTKGIGFLQLGIPHQADKTIVYATDSPGIALLDTKDKTVTKQDIALSSAESKILSLATYGSRLYLYDSVAKNIFSYSKNLLGYSGGSAWVSDQDFPTDNIVSIAIDGNVYTLHSDGSIRRLFKNKQAKFTAEEVTPGLAGADKIITSEGLHNLYVLDTANKRVVIFNKKGELIRQLFLDVAQRLSDITVSKDEATIYVLDGTRVLSISLIDKENQ